MTIPELSKQQHALVQAVGHCFAEACPGAGKTRAIAARYLRRVAEEHRKGIALLSFTNAAVDEVRSRCGDRSDVLAVPHFVGTFDSFINRFITRPLYVRQYNRTPRFTESWQGDRRASFRIPNMGQIPSLSLSWFEFDWMLRATLRAEWLPFRHQRTFAPLIAARRDELEAEATRMCRILVANGSLSCAASRALTAGCLRRSEDSQLFGALLGARFSEVIVDEAQDCGPEDLRVLELLRESGVTVFAVADLDQSIFEFRRAAPEAVGAFADSFGTRLTLDGNYRSAPAICALNNSLRHGSREETALGRHASCMTPVQLVGFQRPGEVAAAVKALLPTHDLPRSEVVFLAHRGSDAHSCAGSPGDSTAASINPVLAIARSSSVLHSDNPSGRDRRRAVDTVEQVLRTIAGGDEHDRPVLDERWLRVTAMRLAMSLDPADLTAKDFACRLRQYVRSIPWPTGTTPISDLGTLLRAPQSEWLTPTEAEAETFAAATIHSVKGREFSGVVVVLPRNLLKDAASLHVLDHWEQRLSSELRRVLYVGASRAQRLLILAVHNDHRDRVARLLKDDGVPYERTP